MTLVGNRFDEDVARTASHRFLQAPNFEGGDYINSSELTANWLRQSAIFTGQDKPDLVFVGGWPFFSALSYFKEVGIPAFFVDFGAVPLDGFAGRRAACPREVARAEEPGTSVIPGASWRSATLSCARRVR